MKIRSYRELKRLKTFEEKFEYLKLTGQVGMDTFGFDRYLNQHFYRSKKWKDVRNQIIIRDNGCDLGDEDYAIPRGARLIVHHMNPITLAQVENDDDILYNPEYLVCVSNNTHQAIHYGDVSLLPKPPIERRLNDTIPWKGGTYD